MFNAIYAGSKQANLPLPRSEVETSGNPLAHVILRGASERIW